MIHSSAFRMPGYTVGSSFPAITPPVLVGFKNNLRLNSANFYTSDRMAEMNFSNPFFGFGVPPFGVVVCGSAHVKNFRNVLQEQSPLPMGLSQTNSTKMHCI